MLLAENGTILKAQECDYKENMDAINDLASPSPIAAAAIAAAAVAAVRLQHILIRNFFLLLTTAPKTSQKTSSFLNK